MVEIAVIIPQTIGIFIVEFVNVLILLLHQLQQPLLQLQQQPQLQPQQQPQLQPQLQPQVLKICAIGQGLINGPVAQAQISVELMKETVTVMHIVKEISVVETTIVDLIFIHWQIVAMIQVKVI